MHHGAALEDAPQTPKAGAGETPTRNRLKKLRGIRGSRKTARPSKENGLFMAVAPGHHGTLPAIPEIGEDGHGASVHGMTGPSKRDCYSPTQEPCTGFSWQPSSGSFNGFPLSDRTPCFVASSLPLESVFPLELETPMGASPRHVCINKGATQGCE